MIKKVSFVLSLAILPLLGADAQLICSDDPDEYKYCSVIQQFHYTPKDDVETIIYMTDSLAYLNDAKKGGMQRDLAEKIFMVMKDINKTIKIATNEVRKEKYKAMGMVVSPVQYGSSAKLKYKKMDKMARGKMKSSIKKFYNQFEKHDDEFLTDLLVVNGSKFVVLPEIVQYDEFKNSLKENNEADFQIAIDGFFGREKGMSESIVTLGLKIDKNKNIRRVFDRKAEYEKIKKAIIALVDNALGDIASQDE
jgi:hypothetical protein